MSPTRRRPGRRWLAVAGALILGLGVATAVPGTASAATTTVQYPIAGNTHINATDSDLALGPGTLTATLDLTTGAITGSVNLPPATGSFKELGFVPVTATTEFVEAAPTTGTLDLATGVVTTTSHVTLRLTDLVVAGINTPVGNHCETTAPAEISLTSQPGFNVLLGGNVAGTYTIPPFEHCLLATLLINLTIPGPGNTIALTLGRATPAG